jgi:2-succinyl-5-enolpyruvyl-6-hydroxy-3-cyclohexene-1-carboxylate synthase
MGMPIREWDLAATRDPKGFAYAANRGLNGIDGQVSSFYGWDVLGPKVAVLGDLTTLHDLNGFWAARWAKNAAVVVLQNQGGRIFDFGVPMSKGKTGEAMVNSHSLNFEGVAALYGLEYFRKTAINADGPGTQDPIFPYFGNRPALIELVCDVDATRAFWKAFRES